MGLVVAWGLGFGVWQPASGKGHATGQAGVCRV